MHHHEEEPNGVQGLPLAEVLAGGHVEERFTLRPPFELVQDTLSAAGAAAATLPGSRQLQQRSESAGFVAELAESNAASIVCHEPLLAATVHQKRADDAAAGRVRQAPGLVAVNKLAGQSQLRQLNRDRRQAKRDSQQAEQASTKHATAPTVNAGGAQQRSVLAAIVLRLSDDATAWFSAAAVALPVLELPECLLRAEPPFVAAASPSGSLKNVRLVDDVCREIAVDGEGAEQLRRRQRH